MLFMYITFIVPYYCIYSYDLQVEVAEKKSHLQCKVTANYIYTYIYIYIYLFNYITN